MPHRDEAFHRLFSPKSLPASPLISASRSNPRPARPPACFPASTSTSASAPSLPLRPLLISRLVNSRVSRRPPGSSSARRAPLKLRIARPRSAHSLPRSAPRRRRRRRRRHDDDELLCLGLEPPPPLR
ncbi:hypothetical protein SEVIR_7G252750v4 [Setaria viridis]|uniref:Uncharacterized protein n=1 Tax=Setaria viridis TaxID=4556 RepID=A0A4U6TXZ3_SETVI|nr:hypothetical protein SEVIR_7G252750v2 [Setaria viridis]